MGFPNRTLPFALDLLAVLLASCAAQAPTGYECFAGYNCYRLYPTKVTWGQAEELCKIDGAHLGLINSDEEAFIYSGIFSRTPGESEVYVGITDLYLEGTWLTVFGDSLESTGYTKWGQGEPNNSKDEDCGAMYQGGLLNDVDCGKTHVFMCEIEVLDTNTTTKV